MDRPPCRAQRSLCLYGLLTGRTLTVRQRPQSQTAPNFQPACGNWKRRGRQLPLFLEGYCGQRLQISGARRQGAPRFRPPCLGPRPYTISAVNSFAGSFVRVIWPDHQPRSAVAATPLADSTDSDHDSPNAPATVRSVYVFAHTAATENAACTMALGLGCGRYFQMMWLDSNTGPEVNQGLYFNK